MSARALEVRGLRKTFGGVEAVAGVDLTVADHELVALVGPSGCGKSTLLRLAAGLLSADGGDIRIGGDVVDDGVRRVEPEHRRTGLVFQEHALFPHLSVGDNIAFGLRDLPRTERAGRRDHWLSMIGLSGYSARYPHELSGGERQRVALARALAPAPRLMLLDEPFASLDPNLRARLRSDIVEVLRTTGTPALFVTHDQAEALSIGDRVAVMRAGRIEQDGSPDDVYHRPVNRFVAGFMGDAAFLPVDQGCTELGPCHGPLVDGPVGSLLVVRPHDVVIDADGHVTATVVGADFHGATRTYRLRLPSGAEVWSTVLHTTHADLGAEVTVTLRPR